MTEEVRPIRESPLSEHVRGSLISAAVGVGIIFLVTLEQSARFQWRSAAYGALMGVFGYVFCAGAALALHGWLDRSRAPRLARAIVYSVAGMASWVLASWIAGVVGLVHVRFTLGGLATYLPIVGAISLLLGLLFYSFGLLQDRLRKSVERLKEAEFAEKELEIARAIQQRILPPPELSGDGFHIAARNLAARFVAGDFYDFFRLPDGALGVVVADVAGKGMGASLIMATVKAALPFLAAERSVAETLREANRRIAPRLAPREFVALAYLRYETETGAFTLGNAGLPDPYRVGRAGAARALSVPGPRFPLGVRPEVAYEEIHGVLEAGERLVLLTDGLPEAPDAAGNPLGYERFEALLPGALDPDALFASVRAASGPGLEDDWTALFLERRGQVSQIATLPGVS
ncbi:MAG TPA: PP2C family protein-serine/threonine phosphatase [Thermoanaerobaculia bacterium]|nr:PP2C family protein-serine/threonine phosphatase [Thermoanaerobaculia bacterium]